MYIYIYKSLTFNRLEVLHHLLRNNFSNDWCGMHRTFTRVPGGCLRWPPTPPGPRWPPAESKCEKRSAKSKKNETSKTARRFTSLQMFHTHARLPRGFFQWITTPLLEAKKRKKFFISSDVPHTRPDAARLFSRCLFIYIYIHIYIYIYIYKTWT